MVESRKGTRHVFSGQAYRTVSLSISRAELSGWPADEGQADSEDVGRHENAPAICAASNPQ